MFSVFYTSRFKKDLKKGLRQHRDINKLFLLIDLLVNDKPLPPQSRLHPLKGDYEGYWDCHINPDWGLIFRFDKAKKLIELVRIGSHADLF
jgi:mRNA interferase YafQ